MKDKMSKIALVTGITGQDGAYLSELLISLGYKVYGTYRRTSTLNFWRIKELGIIDNNSLNLIELDITDLSSCIHILEKTMPDEVYNLAAQSFVGLSFEAPVATSNITGLGVLNLLEAIRIVNKKIKFYQASTSELYGKVIAIPQNESTPFYPRSPYGVAKLYGHWMTINYRESYDIFASCGILFNHESPLRGLDFVTRKITDGLSRISLGIDNCLLLGNLDAKRDWGYAKEYVQGMWKMLQINEPDTFVLATGRAVSIRDFISISSAKLDMNIEWRGRGVNEIGFDLNSKKEIIKVSENFFRPAEVDILLGDPTKANDILGWKTNISVEMIASMMIEADLERNKNNTST